MKLAFISETATGRLHERANALTDELVSTRVVIVCGQIETGPSKASKAGRQMHNLMRAMRLLRYVHGSEIHELRQPALTDVAVKAIIDKARHVTGICYPAGPQAVSLVLIAEAPLIRTLAPHFGAEFDPEALFTIAEIML